MGDQVGYARHTVVSLLPCVWDDQFIITGHPARAQRGGARVRSTGPSMEWECAVADVQVGYARAALDPVERDVLRLVSHEGWTVAEIAGSWGVEPDDVWTMWTSGVGKIVDWLNGRKIVDWLNGRRLT